MPALSLSTMDCLLVRGCCKRAAEQGKAMQLSRLILAASSKQHQAALPLRVVRLHASPSP